MEVSGQLHAPGAKLGDYSPWYLCESLDGPTSRPGRFRDEKGYCLCQESNSDSSIAEPHSLAAIPTELSCLPNLVVEDITKLCKFD
jgi:hypothetical protein